MNTNEKKLVELTTAKNQATINSQNVQSLGELELSIEDKAAHLALQVNQVIIRPYLNQALDYLVNARDQVVGSYHSLSDEILQEVSVLIETNKALSEEVATAKKAVVSTQDTIRNRYNSTTEFEIASGVLNLDHEYNQVAENYEKSMQFSQEIIKNRMRIESLLETQKLLDVSLSNRVGEIQLEIDNLTFILNNLHATHLTPTNHLSIVDQFVNGATLASNIEQQKATLGYQNDQSLSAHTFYANIGKKFIKPNHSDGSNFSGN